MLFTSSTTGEQYGYRDEWQGDSFLYAGEGQVGDQSLRGGNAAVANHLAAGKALRLFEGTSGVVQYAGEFTIDQSAPWSFVQASQRDSAQQRRVLRFRLVPLDAPPTSQPAQLTEIGVPYSPQNASIQVKSGHPVSELNLDEYGSGLREHRSLEGHLAAWATGNGLIPRSPGLGDPNFDVVWKASDGSHVVVEVKSTTRANRQHQLRLGLGQVLEFQWVLAKTYPSVKAVLYVSENPGIVWQSIAQAHNVLLRWRGSEPSELQ